MKISNGFIVLAVVLASNSFAGDSITWRAADMSQNGASGRWDKSFEEKDFFPQGDSITSLEYPREQRKISMIAKLVTLPAREEIIDLSLAGFKLQGVQVGPSHFGRMRGGGNGFRYRRVQLFFQNERNEEKNFDLVQTSFSIRKDIGFFTIAVLDDVIDPIGKILTVE